MANNDRFRASFAKRINKSKRKFELFVQKLVIDLDKAIILKTPVDKGALHWNWIIGNGYIDKSQLEHVGDDKDGAIARNNQIIKSIKVIGQIIYIANSLPYAYRIEYEGWSKKAPAGMLRLSVVESNQIARKIGAELRML